MEFPVESSRNPNIQYELLTLEDVEDVSLFCMKHFFPREPFGVFYQIKMELEHAISFTQFVRSVIRKGTSYKAVDVSQNRRLVGLELSQVIHKDESDHRDEIEEKQQDETFELKLDPFLMKFLAVLKESCDYFSTFAVDSYFMHEIVAVRGDYGGRGICSELLSLAEQHVRVTSNIEVFVVTTTNVRTQTAYLNAGYQILRQLDFGSFLDVTVRKIQANTGCLQVKYIRTHSVQPFGISSTLKDSSGTVDRLVDRSSVD